jgi:hypothetical protein
MERVVVNRSFTLYKTFYEGAVATDPDSPPTVIIRRDDGTVMAAGAVANEVPAGQWSVTVEASENDQLDYLTVDWAAIVNGEPQEHIDYVEVAGGTLFTIPEARALKPLDNTTTYSTASLVAMRNTVEDALEHKCGVAFVPRYTRETLTGLGNYGLLPTWPKLRAVRSASATYNGTTTTLSASDLLGLTWGAYAGLYGYSWTSGYPWSIGYEHGYDRPPEEIKRAALILTKIWLGAQNRPVDDRAITFNTSEGGTYSLAVPGRNGSHFGHPDVDAAVDRYSFSAMVA